ncbi:recombinase family protein [Lactococcus cremoris]|uniref:recombinase family protein n=1 Tax=Lactococcus lactis subsp. cremoris TaxID=1359 RepID=UPI001C792F0C|nr:recombinase family protein [Lactococcus cremoris]QWT77050.1 integrase [Lactococcus phage CAP]MCT0501617.1 recombinase family protein [Lactococcus cremoris]MCT4435151.1 recombinase family protein [Lactococcus cremoris]MDA2881629.1 recombinase family protein [Lactococcus cremoris]MDA2884154.1 recombinase family protein [Lactococcus cremoris]
MTKKVAIYTRVSTTNQAEEGFSIDEQIDRLTKYAEAMGWQVSDTYTDAGFSGAKLERPAMQRLINDIENKAFDTVLVYKLDRLSRSVRDTLYLVKDVFTKNKIDFISLNESIDTSSAMGSLFLTILSAINEFERENIKERMTMGKLGRAKSGKSMMWAKTAFGYYHNKDTGILEIVPLQATIVEQIFTDYLSGVSLTKLRDKLNEAGHIGKDIPWSYRTLRQTLDNPVYCGYIKFKDSLFEGMHKPIIPYETYLKVQKELEKRQQQTYERNNNPRPFQAKYMLSGMARCGYCGAPLKIVLGHKRKDGSRTMKYHCANRFPRKTKGITVYNDNKKCDSGNYDLSNLENTVIDNLIGFQENNDSLLKIINGNNQPILDTSSFKKQISQIDKKIQKNSDLYLNDFITMDELKDRTDSLQAEKKLLKAKISENKFNDSTDVFELVKTQLGSIPINELSYDNKKKIVNNLVSKVDVTADNVDIIFKFQLA